MQSTQPLTPAVKHRLGYWDLMEAIDGTVSSEWEMAIESTPTHSGFEAASLDEDLSKDASNSELSQLLDFIHQGPRLQAVFDFTEALYHPTLHQEIRVLKLAPGRYEQPLIAALEHINLEFESFAANERGWRRPADFGLSFSKNKKVPYTAISYCWGDADFVCPILVSEHYKTITRTLDDILRHLRDEYKPVTVWVDQLCIDQTSDTDKGNQVKLMDLVYGRARNTVIWLGREAGREAFAALRKLALDTTGVRPELSAEEIAEYRNPSGMWAEYAQGTKDLRSLLNKPWFQRTWIIQEAVLSVNVHFMAGHDTITWEDFAGDCVKTVTFGIFDDDVNMHTDKIKGRKSGWVAAAALYSARSSNTGGSMLFWLVETRYARVTHPVDKIYGILGLCEQNDIIPDYTKPAEQLYWEVALHLLRPRLAELERKAWKVSPQKIVEFLCCVDHDTNPGTSKLPSWAPDWSQPRFTTPLAYGLACLSYYPSSSVTRRRNFFLSGCEKRLSITARAAGHVTHVSDIFLDTELTMDITPTNNASLRNCIEFIGNPDVSKVYDQHDLWKTFCSTLVAGKDHTGFQKCPEDYIETLSFLCDLTTARSPTFAGQTYSTRQKKPIGRGGLTVNHFAKGTNSRRFESLKGAYQNALLNRRLCWTDTGHLALVSRFTRRGDMLFMIPGAVVPFILRRLEEGKYILIGECYAISLMSESEGESAREVALWEYSTVDIV